MFRTKIVVQLDSKQPVRNGRLDISTLFIPVVCRSGRLTKHKNVESNDELSYQPLKLVQFAGVFGTKLCNSALCILPINDFKPDFLGENSFSRALILLPDWTKVAWQFFLQQPAYLKSSSDLRAGLRFIVSVQTFQANDPTFFCLPNTSEAHTGRRIYCCIDSSSHHVFECSLGGARPASLTK